MALDSLDVSGDRTYVSLPPFHIGEDRVGWRPRHTPSCCASVTSINIDVLITANMASNLVYFTNNRANNNTMHIA